MPDLTVDQDGVDSPHPAAFRLLYDAFRALDCTTALDPADQDDCASVADEAVRVLLAAGLLLPAGTTTEERWSVRWTWPDERSDGMSCERRRGSSDTRTAHERATAHASRHTSNGIRGEALRRYVYTTLDEVVERYEPSPGPSDTETSAADTR